MAISRSFGCRWFTTLPPMAMVPALISSSPAIMRSVVDLPQPEGPTSTTNSRSLMDRLMSLTATTWPYTLCTLLSAMSAMRLDPQPANDVSLPEQRYDQRRNEGYGRRRAHEVPFHAEFVHELSHDDGQDRRFMRGEDEREQELVPGIEPAQDRERREAGNGRRHGHAPERAPTRAAVDHGGVFHGRVDAVEEAFHDPGEEANVDGNVRQQQPPIAVENVQLLRHEIERQHPSDVRHATENVDQGKPGVRDRPFEAREHVAGRRGDAQREHRRQGRDHEAVEQRPQDDLLRQHLVEVVDGEFGPPMHVIDPGSGSQRSQYQPKHRKGEQQANRNRRKREEHDLSSRREGEEETGGSRRRCGDIRHFDTSTK